MGMKRTMIGPLPEKYRSSYPEGYYLFNFNDGQQPSKEKRFNVEAEMLAAYHILNGVVGADWRMYQLENGDWHHLKLD